MNIDQELDQAILQAWSKRDQTKAEHENLNRVADSFDVETSHIRDVIRANLIWHLRMSDTGKSLCRLAANEIESGIERIKELESKLSDAQSAADFYQSEADHYYGVSEANE